MPRLAELAEINPAFDRASVGSLDELISFVPMSAVSEDAGAIVEEQERPISDVMKGFTPFSNGDVLVAKITPCFENGKIAHARIQKRVGFGSTEFHVVRPIAERLHDRYLFHYLRQARVRAQGERRMTGSAGQRRVPRDFLESLDLPLPSLQEQRRIAAILDKADALRAKRCEAIAKLDQLQQSVFLEMFGDPVTNSRRWPVELLSALGSLDRGVSRHRPRGAAELLGGKHPLIQTGDVAQSGGYIRNFTATYSDLGLAQSKKWPRGTLCITIAANIASTGILSFDACFPDSVVGFTASSRSTPEFVQGLFTFFRRMLEDSAPQVAQKNINLEILRNLRVPAPPLHLQQQWTRFVEQIEEFKRRFVLADDKCRLLRSSLQREAFGRHA